MDKQAYVPSGVMDALINEIELRLRNAEKDVREHERWEDQAYKNRGTPKGDRASRHSQHSVVSAHLWLRGAATLLWAIYLLGIDSKKLKQLGEKNEQLEMRLPLVTAYMTPRGGSGAASQSW